MASKDLLEKLTEKLAGSNFFRVKSKYGSDDYIRFSGYLTGKNTFEKATLLVCTKMDRPPILFVDRSWFGKVAHVNKEGQFCYCQSNHVVFDVAFPVEQTLIYLDMAQSQWEKYVNLEVTDDIGKEIEAYWVSSRSIDLYLDLDGQQKRFDLRKGIKVNNNSHKDQVIVLSHDFKKTFKRLSVLPIFIGYKWESFLIRTFVFYLSGFPSQFCNPWPPDTLDTLIVWLSKFSKGQSKKVLSYVKKNNAEPALLVFKFRDGQSISCIAEPKKRFLNPIRSKSMLKSVDYRLLPVQVKNLSESSQHVHNMNGVVSLRDKDIVLVGCGTIGGYLADGLVSAGGGIGKGTITVIDPDVLSIRNVGRHRLGYGYVGLNKAKALAQELLRKNPAINIKVLRDDNELAVIPDLLIDSTGEEGVGRLLAQKYNLLCDMLSVWIEDNGAVVSTFFHSKGKVGCYDCLCRHSRSGIFKVLKNPPKVVLAGSCSDMYMPFSVAVSLFASAYAMTKVLQWAKGESIVPLGVMIIDSMFEPNSERILFKYEHLCDICQDLINREKTSDTSLPVFDVEIIRREL